MSDRAVEDSMTTLEHAADMVVIRNVQRANAKYQAALASGDKHAEREALVEVDAAYRVLQARAQL